MSSRMSESDADSETRHCRTSPGGSTPSSSRSLPVEPPSSTIETIAVRLTGYFLRPERTVKLPVPPPMMTMFLCFVAIQAAMAHRSRNVFRAHFWHIRHLLYWTHESARMDSRFHSCCYHCGAYDSAL